MAKVYVGMSGWTYKDWRGGFYPKGVTQKQELHYASRQMNSIEINGTFYSLQKPESFERWHDETPEDFVFSVKGPQYITHIRRLKDVAEPLANFFASGLLCLKEKMGPLLWQFPPNMMLKDGRFEKFLKLLPHDSKAAARLAKKHTDKVKGRSHTQAGGDYSIRHAFEFRHDSFIDPGFFELLREHNVAIVIAHSGEKSPYTEELTADFVYARMHGQEAKFKKGYAGDNATMDWLAGRVNTWSNQRKRDVHIYFDTEAKDYAPHDALALSSRLKLKLPKAG